MRLWGFLLLLAWGLAVRVRAAGPEAGGAGSASCRKCHPEFHQRWETSVHGQSIRAFSGELLAGLVPASGGRLVVSGRPYDFEWGATGAWVVEGDGLEAKRWPVAQVLGGREMFYFLTRLEGNRDQVLPMALDVHRREWFSPAVSATRHMGGQGLDVLDWKAPEYAFNISCYGCHVSGVRPTRPGADTMRWSEPGISCETCHGDAREHAARFEAAANGAKPSELAILSFRTLERSRQDALCGSCHARRERLTARFEPGADYFDHCSLVGLENEDFLPDGRVQGEGYTFLDWRENPCARSGELGCLHCHTSSGRNRFQDRDPDSACLPCHAARVAEGQAHTHHPAGRPGGRCVDCHMAPREFARFTTHDHAFRPPSPAASRVFGGSNACNDCHRDKDSTWADSVVRRWWGKDYQAPVLRRGRWIAAARAGDWRQLPAMLASLRAEVGNEVYRASLLRLLAACDDPRKLPEVLACFSDPSPWVRSAAVEACGDSISASTLGPLLKTAADARRLVRVRAGLALARVPLGALSGADALCLSNAWQEVEQALNPAGASPADQLMLGRFLLARGDRARAVAILEKAIRDGQDLAALRVSAATACFESGHLARAEMHLRRALELEPASEVVWFNWILFLERAGRSGDAVDARHVAQQRVPVVVWGQMAQRLERAQRISASEPVAKRAP